MTREHVRQVMVLTAAGLAACAAVREAGSWARLSATWSSSAIPVEMIIATGRGDFDQAGLAALDAWNGAGSLFRFAGSRGAAERASCTRSGIDNRNVAVFSEDKCGRPWGRAIAATHSWRLGDDFVDVDVLFNSNSNWEWAIYDGTPRPGVPDFRRVALHEFGHVLGLDHPDDHGQHVAAIMNSSASEVDRLQPDDRAGARALYGSDGSTAPDLTVRRLTVDSATTAPGERRILTAELRNAGTGYAPGSGIDYQRRGRGYWEDAGFRSTPPLQAGATHEAVLGFYAPSTPGVHDYRACAVTVPEERDTTNNCSEIVRLYVEEPREDPPDLAVSVFTAVPTEAAPEDPITLLAHVENSGGSEAPAAALTFELRDGAYWTGIESGAVPRLPAGSRHTTEFDTTAPAYPGRYEYRACASELEDEPDHLNNCSDTSTVDVRIPCIVNDLGGTDRELRGAGSWNGACSSPRNSADGARARYYGFLVHRTAEIRIRLSSRARAGLALIAGRQPEGGLIAATSGADPAARQKARPRPVRGRGPGDPARGGPALRPPSWTDSRMGRRYSSGKPHTGGAPDRTPGTDRRSPDIGRASGAAVDGPGNHPRGNADQGRSHDGAPQRGGHGVPRRR